MRETKIGKNETKHQQNEKTALANLRKDSSIKILLADKGNPTVVMKAETCSQKIDGVLRKGNYTFLAKDPTSTIKGRIYRLLTKHGRYIPEKIRIKLTPYHSRTQHIYGLPKIHKQDMPLRPITSTQNSATSELAKFFPILRPLQGNTSSWVKNSQHFVEIIREIEVQREDHCISFDVETLYTNVPVKESKS